MSLVHQSQRSACLQQRAPQRVSAQPRLRRVGCNALKVMIAGPPGCGKGTQCAKIVDEYGLEHISVGDLLRAQVADGTTVGLKAKEFMDSGNLVPDDVVVEMVVGKLGECEAGWLLDGYPRSASQAQALEKRGIRPDVVLLINVPDEAIVERVVGRRLDPETGEIYHMTFKPPPADIVDRLTQRDDDTEEKAMTRINVYKDNIKPIQDLYEEEIITVDGNVGMDAVFLQIESALDQWVSVKAA